MGKFWVRPEIVEFSDDAFTERGEKVYKTLEMTVNIFGGTPIKRVVRADDGIGFTEEWIEETVQGALEQLKKDFPNDVYRVLRLRPNQIVFEYAGVTGLVN